MKAETIQLRFDADQYSALSVALEFKGSSVEAELAATFDTLFEKNVHKAVKEFLLLNSCKQGSRPRSARREKPASTK